MTYLDTISRFLNAPVLVVGDLMLDEFVWGSVSRISPEAPVPVVEVSRRTFVVGGAANTAANVAALGGWATIAGVIGDDNPGERIKRMLADGLVDTDAVATDSTRPTTTKTRIVAHSQQVVRIDHENSRPISIVVEDDLLVKFTRALAGTRAVVLSDYGKGVVTERFAQVVIAACRRANVPIIVDPKGTDYAKYKGAHLVKPNQLEAGKVLNRDLRDRQAVDRAGADLREQLGPETAVLITQGANGMSLFEPNRAVVHVPAQAREVFDVTGAGDTVAATLALTLAAGSALPEACRLASAAAAVVVAKAGTATLTIAELTEAMTRLGTPIRQAA